MKTRRSQFAIVVAGTGAALAVLHAGIGRFSRELDGTKWKIHVVPEKIYADKGEKAYRDTLTFEHGRFSSSALRAKGFVPAPYRGEAKLDDAKFEVEQLSESNGVATWLAQIRDGQVAGRLEWRKKNGEYVNYNFTGLKKSSRHRDK